MVLVVDDDESYRRIVMRWLEVAGYEVQGCASGAEALGVLEQRKTNVLLLDIHMDKMDGFSVLNHMHHHYTNLPVIMLTAETGVAQVVRAMQEGAYDYLPKPVERIKLVATVKNALERSQLISQIQRLEREVKDANSPTLIGTSPVMRRLMEQVERVAPSDVTALIYGESGTGKELVARAIHTHSKRHAGPFIAINCAAIPEGLQESELFGHEKGAFTGASARRIGRLEQADGGTLFLDEVVELSPTHQASLLRALQERRFYRVGGREEVKVNVRIVAATHNNLREAVAAKRFREDLYFRLAVFEVELPPLRDRGEDIVILARRFVREQAARHGKERLQLALETEQALLSWHWPGNVRELQNAIERAIVDAQGELIRPENLPAQIQLAVPVLSKPPLPAQASLSDAPRSLSDIERDTIADSLKRHNGNIVAACKELGIPRSTMYRRIVLYGLK